MIIYKKEKKISQWISLSAKKIIKTKFKKENSSYPYHSIKQNDYVSVFVEQKNGMIPLVKQYRPAVEQFTLEFPGGTLDKKMTPQATARQEVFEETGIHIVGKPLLLGCLQPDTGRLENRLWAYYAQASATRDRSWIPEPDLRVVFVSKSEFKEMINRGRFKHALHLALVGLALTKGVFSW